MSERELADLLDSSPKYRRGRLRDVVSGRYLTLRVNDLVSEELASRDLTFDAFEDSRSRIRTFVDSMPSGDVYVSLTTAAHRNPHTNWSGRTIFDIDALSMATAYCDIVVTEKHFGKMLVDKGIAERLGTKVLTDLRALPSAL